jgi:hypothetical protein
MVAGAETRGAEFVVVGGLPPDPPPPPQANKRDVATHKGKTRLKVCRTGIARTSLMSTIAPIDRVTVTLVRDSTGKIRMEPAFERNADGRTTAGGGKSVVVESA